MAGWGADTAVEMAAVGEMKTPTKSVNIGKYRSIALINCLSRQSEVYEREALLQRHSHI